MTQGLRGWHLPSAFIGAHGLHNPEEIEGAGGVRYLPLEQDQIGALSRWLRGHRDRNLRACPVRRILDAVHGAASRFSRGGGSFRRRAVDLTVECSGYSRPMAEEVVDGMVEGWSRPALESLLSREFVDPGVLDRFVPDGPAREARALGYPLAFHLGAGSVPGVSVTSLIRSLLVKSAVLLKPGRGDLPLPRLFTEALSQEDEELAANVAVVYWPQEESWRTLAAARHADLAVVYGGDDTVRWLRESLPAHVPLVSYRHRLGVAYVGRDGLADSDLPGPLGPEERGAGEGGAQHPAGGGPGGRARSPSRAEELARRAAEAAGLFDQQGCVSPHVFFVEKGGRVTPEAWAESLAKALDNLEERLPSGDPPPAALLSIQQARRTAELQEALGELRVFHAGPRAPWTVVCGVLAELEPSCLHRNVRVVPVEGPEEALALMQRWRPYLQTVGVEGVGERLPALAEALAGLGVSRVTSLAAVPWPPAAWHHDGMGPLRALLRWTDLELD